MSCRRGWWRGLCLALVLVVAWLVLAPSWLGRMTVERVLMSKLNDAQKGLSCASVEVRFGYFDLLVNRRVEDVRVKDLRLDLSRRLPPAALKLVSSGEVRLDEVRLTGGRERGKMRLCANGRALDWKLAAEGAFDLCATTNFLGAAADLSVVLGEAETAGGALTVKGAFLGTPSDWTASAALPQHEIASDGALVRPLLSRLEMPESLSNLVFSTRLSGSFEARRTPEVPVAVWSAKLPVRELSVSADLGKVPLEVSKVSARLSARGGAGLVVVEPVSVRARSLSVAGFDFNGPYAKLMTDGGDLLVSEAGADVCGGQARLYAVHLDPARQNAGVTLFLDEIDAGEVFARLPSFKGRATGRLSGKLPLAIRGGSKLRLSDAYLSSSPGEKGSIRVEDAAALTAGLQAGGVPASECENLAKALSALDYDVLRLRLTRESANEAALSVLLRGSATHEGVTVPVDFAVTFRGAIEELLNVGLKASLKNKR